MFDVRALLRGFEKGQDRGLRRRTAAGEPGEREILIHVRVLLQLLIHELLMGVHLRGRRSLLCNEDALDESAIARRQKRGRQVREEDPETEHAADQYRCGEPCAIEEPIEPAPIALDHALNPVANPLLDARLFVTRSAFAQHARGHEWRERERDQPRGEDRYNDRDRKLAEDAA